MKIFCVLALLLFATPLLAATQTVRAITDCGGGSAGATYYKAQRKVGTGAYQDIPAASNLPTCSFIEEITGDTGGITYCYHWAAGNTAGLSAYNQEGCGVSKGIIVIPDIPPNTTLILETISIQP